MKKLEKQQEHLIKVLNQENCNQLTKWQNETIKEIVEIMVRVNNNYSYCDKKNPKLIADSLRFLANEIDGTSSVTDEK